MSASDPQALAQELDDAYAHQRPIAVPPSARNDGFDLASAYAVESELARRRALAGHQAVGRKVGYANKAMWRALKLETLVWARMYDDTVHYASGGAATLSVAQMYSPKIEPEIVFRLKRPLTDGDTDPAAVLAAVEWIALGFEIIDCMYPEWKFQPADFVAAYGLHAALIAGERRQMIRTTSRRSSTSCHGSRCGSLATGSSSKKDPERTRCAAPRCALPSSPPPSHGSRARARSSLES